MTAPDDPQPAAVGPGETPRPDPWRAEVAAFRNGERRRRFPMGMHLGAPAGRRRSVEVPWPVPPDYDAGLRLDLIIGLLDGLVAAEPAEAPKCSAWITRPGEPVLHDRDVEWGSAATHAFAAHGVRLLGFRTVTRSGWLDAMTGDRRVWRRLRL